MKKPIKILVITLAVMQLTGCAAFDAAKEMVSPNKVPKNIKEFSDVAKTPDNANISVEMGLDVSVKANGVSAEIPVNLSMDLACAGEYGHGTMTVTTELAGKEDQKGEIYIDEDYIYTKNNDGAWEKKGKDKSTAGILSAGQKLNKKIFKNAEFSYSDKKEEYTITVPGEDFIKEMDVMDSITNGIAPDGDYEIESGDVVYIYDKDYTLKRIKTNDIILSTTVNDESNGESAKVKIVMNIDIKYSNIDGIDEEDVKTPQKIKKEAVEAAGTDTLMGGEEENEDQDDARDDEYSLYENIEEEEEEEEKEEEPNKPAQEHEFSYDKETTSRYLDIGHDTIALSFPEEWNVNEQSSYATIFCYTNYFFKDVDVQIEYYDSMIDIGDAKRIKQTKDSEDRIISGEHSDIITFTDDQGRENVTYYTNTDNEKCRIVVLQDIGAEHYVGINISVNRYLSEDDVFDLIQVPFIGNYFVMLEGFRK